MSEKAEKELSSAAAPEGAKAKVASTTASAKFSGEAAGKATGNEGEGIDATKGKSM